MDANPTARPRRIARVRVALVALAAAVALAACQPTAPYTYAYTGGGSGGGARVAVVGDSITAHAEAHLLSALAPRNRAVGGVPSMTMAAALDERLRPAIASSPQILVVELGLNDALDGWDSSDLPVLETTLRELDVVPCVVWVTPSALAPSYYDHLGPGSMQDRAAAFKASLAKRLPKHPNQHLADWSAVQLQHPEWFHGDHLHHVDAGHEAYATFVADALSVCG